MFKKICKSMLKEENYIDALSYLSGRFINLKTYEQADRELERIDSILWNMVSDCDESENALRISTALQIAIDIEF